MRIVGRVRLLFGVCAVGSALTVAALAAFAACSPFGDASSSAAAADGASGDSSSLDGAAGPDAVACASGAHRFCDDFDQGNLGDSWTTKTGDPAVIDLSDAQALSPPRSLEAQLGNFDSDGGPPDDGHLEKQLDGALDRIVCSIHVFVDTLPSQGEPELIHVDILPTTAAPFTSVGAIVSVTDQLTRLSYSEHYADGGIGSVVSSTGPPFHAQTWQVLTVDVNAKTGALAASVDGKPIASSQLPTAPAANAGATFSIGLMAAYKSNGVHVYIDDASCDTTP